ncbi:MAG: BamA/TamA family outer membrane protein [Gemmatimonadales bacterium]|nr:BamA/TamA family outer membrane protein [Gemmatimonadales bacterium]NIN11105.1 BamA/TamA family outer membrane protein [Gemmatimonadales bacterium]NIN49702.1 BamA/TamA family outer membrane protein [Gemmatimonadales bacterium]NIP07166.1 BamA/TamA family outer membrane protein [Gemmatimonadales bacterium]NIQ99558.1 BamA/TamA family outer membrane protein [Gemmatimonadales bacterium]
MRTAAATLFALTVSASAGLAQIPNLPTLGPSWTDLAYPKVYWTPRDGVTFGLYYAQVRPLGYDDYNAPPPYRGTITLDGHIATSGSKGLELAARFPKMLDGWRLTLVLQAVRRARENFFGIGNDAEFDGDNVTDAQPHFYRSDNRRLIARGEIQRRIIGGLRVLTGFHAEGWRIDTLPGASQLAADLQAGLDPTIGISTADISGRVGLVFDTRNDEVAPRRGVRLEAIYGFADSTVAGDLSYTRATVSATGYLPVRHNLLLAARVVGQSMTGSPGLGSLYHIEASSDPFFGVGGASSHRALRRRRLLDAGKLLANFDVRYDLLAEPTLFRVTLVGFLDAGRVFPVDEFRLTTDDLHVGGGLGLFVQLFRAGILGTTTAVGPDGFTAHFHTQWTY